MSIYITEEQKKEWETEIIDLEYKKSLKSDPNNIWYIQGRIDLLKRFLPKAIVLPTEDSWNDCLSNTERDGCVYSNTNNYPNGVIILNKK